MIINKGEIPKRLGTLKGNTPICVTCIFGQAHKRPWHTKANITHHIRKNSDSEPGKQVLINQIVSAQPDLTPQMGGFLSNLRLMGTTVWLIIIQIVCTFT